MAAQDYGILISAPGNDAGQGSSDLASNKTLLNTRYAFIKLDTQKGTSFQTLTMLITHDPPEPSGSAYKYTVLYSFAHGYTYRPALESLFHITTAGASTKNSQSYFQNEGQLSQQTVDDYANIYAIADATNVYIICTKFNDGAGSPNVLTGTNLQITLHVFVEDIGI